MDSLACSSKTHNYEMLAIPAGYEMLAIPAGSQANMKLAPFIRANIEAIAAEWERFAATLLPEENFSVSLLRDDIVDILNDVAADMDRHQSAAQQQKKIRGRSGGFRRRSRKGVCAARRGAGQNEIVIAATRRRIQGAPRNGYPIVAAQLG